ncbi:MAG: hypothetical protein HYZ53_06235 [Planctomycetes bacterium]|nr:hypothetical protein [Planctomycetota bacterium]
MNPTWAPWVEALHLLTLLVWVAGELALLLPRWSAASAATGEVASAVLAFLDRCRRFDHLKMACAAVLLATSAIKYGRLESNLGWYHVRYTLVALLVTTGLYGAFAVTPRLTTLARGLGGGERDEAGAEPRRVAFERLHRLLVASAYGELLAALGILAMSAPAPP